MAKKKRIDLQDEAGGLSSSPFAGLAAQLPTDLPSGPGQDEGKAQENGASGLPYSIGKTRKGGYPITLERRAKGKIATVIGKVSGDANALLKDLKKRCGAGGVVREGSVELQGDHRAALEKLLRTMGF